MRSLLPFLFPFHVLLILILINEATRKECEMVISDRKDIM